MRRKTLILYYVGYLKNHPKKIIILPGVTQWTKLTYEEEITKGHREELTNHFQQASKNPFVQTGLDREVR